MFSAGFLGTSAPFYMDLVTLYFALLPLLRITSYNVCYTKLLRENGKLLWERVYGGDEDDVGYDLAVTNDGYIIVGETADNRTRKTDVFIVKTDKNGKVASK